MITIEKNLPAFAFAGNPVLLKAISDNVLSTEGIKASMQISVSNVDTTAGHTFTLSFNNIDLLFTSATTPDDSGLQYEKASGTDTYVTWAVKIHAAFLANYYLATYFDIVLYPADDGMRIITLTAKEVGSAYSLTLTAGTATGVGEESGTVEGVDPAFRENFVIVASLWNGTIKIAEDTKPIDIYGRVTFNFSEYLMALLETDDPRFTWPDITEVYCNEFTNYVKLYQVSLAEKYDGVVRKLTFDLIRHAIGGGLSRDTLVAWNEAGNIFFDDADNKKRFLTWAPVMQELGADVPQKIFFVFQDVTAYTQYKLVAVLVMEDGSVFKQDCTALATVTPWSVVECSSGYDQLNLGMIDPTQPVLRWYVFLENEYGNQISETRGFTLDLDTYETQRVFMFRNSFSAYDIVRFTGKGELGPEYDRVSGTRVEDDDYTSLNAPIRLFSAIETQKMKANSGWISLASKKHLRDFMLSREAYEIIDDKLYPIIVTSQKSQAFTSDDIKLLSLDIEYERAYNDMFWSDVLADITGVVIPDREYADDYNQIEYS